MYCASKTTAFYLDSNTVNVELSKFILTQLHMFIRWH